MPRLQPLERDEVSAAAQAFYDRDVERYGMVLNNTKLYAHSLPILTAVKSFVVAFGESDAIPLALKALVRVRVATLNGCPF